jgi:pimeloyl-ACP methyl ester carboxylesterase
VALVGVMWPFSIARGRALAELDYGRPVRRVSVDGQEIAIVDLGRGDPAIVLVHGLGSDLRAWQRNLDALAQRHRVVALDLPGFGRSSKPRAMPSLAGWAACVDALTHELGLDDFVLAGHSMGGQLALHHALAWPGRARALVLVAPAGFETFTAAESSWLRAHVDPFATRTAGAWQVVARWLQAFHRMPPEAWPLVRDRIAVIGGPDFDDYCRTVAGGVAAMLDEPVRDRLPSVRVPTLVVFGREDRLVPNRWLHRESTSSFARAAANALPNAELLVVPHAGHMVQFERPDAWNEAVLTFVSRVVGNQS